ncbi:MULTISPECIES: hypothetical protein [Streptomyces]|uniref:hypothetical protein n=1 Tax=Streptomyces TaxID=1883 RepID=UPI00102E49E6|nr:MULTISPECIES: hypothetical protein [Streptomyces]MYS64209.1 hypothetical protein [Streptomyces sp. SID5473]TAI43626.1 hypothetical protein EWI31_17960 [Streptomyces tsukubensis]
MGDDSLAMQMARLRIRAGNPSLRELEKLTERQGRRMSRASIQDKFSGNSQLKMVHVLALVQACADHARSIGAPLSPADSNLEAWREKATQSSTPRIRQAPKSENTSNNREALNPPELHSLITPLINAGMEDIARIATEGENHPIETWLPAVLTALDYAHMDTQGFVNLAVHQPPQQTVEILTSVSESEAEDAANLYFESCLLAKPPAEVPKFLVALRRHDQDASHWYANEFIDALAGKGEWPGVFRMDMANVLRALRSATLKNDADKLAVGIGLHSRPRIALTTAGSFPEDFLGDRELILSAAAQGGPNRLLSFIKYLRKEATAGIDPNRTLTHLLDSVPQNKRGDFYQVLHDAGMDHEAKVLLALETENPF